MTAAIAPSLATTLADLAQVANREHQLVLQSGRAIVEHAVRAGEALLEAKRLIGHGGWTRWLDESFEQSPKTANDYMRIARYKDFVLAHGPGSLNAATRLLRESDVPRPRDVHNDAVRERAVELHLQKTPQRDIAALLGTTPEQVTYLLNPESYEKRLRSNRDKRRERAAERQARQQAADARAVKRAARKAGGAMAELYAMAERMQDVLSAAHDETNDREARQALTRGGEHYRKLRDEVVRALGTYDRRQERP